MGCGDVFFPRVGKRRRYSGYVVNPCFTAAQCVRVTVQPVANLIHLRCSSFLPHLPHLTRAYRGMCCDCVSGKAFLLQQASGTYTGGVSIGVKKTHRQFKTSFVQKY